ncbi:MAG: hypothetical protein HY899_07395 [Deltaproteobacteria bacterium]|nr:hypothetical protein [Deltaproteobacteria bacterium]
MNEQNTQQNLQQAIEQTGQKMLSSVGLTPEALVQKQLMHVGAAYGVIFALLLFYAWRLTATTRRLSERVDELERESGAKH